MFKSYTNHWHHHGRFYMSLAVGIAGGLAAWAFRFKMAAAVGADLFFLSYITAFWWVARRLTPTALKKEAAVEDEGAVIVTMLIVLAVGYTSAAIFTALHDKATQPLPLAIVMIGAPLGWFLIHLNEAFHYSNLYYAKRGKEQDAQRPLEFPETPAPGIADFIYFSFVIGMTAQTSDTEVSATSMRSAVTIHSTISFFYNTILIAMAVNAVVSRAG